MRHPILLALGSNHGNREAFLREAIILLQKRHIISTPLCSSLYESEALLPEDAPESWNTPYLNMVLSSTTGHSPQSLLKSCQMIEREIGRQRRGHWGPREIDIDILAHGRYVLQTDTLSLPHKEMTKRSFVLIPLAEIAPEWRYPARGEHYQKTAKTLARTVKNDLKKKGILP